MTREEARRRAVEAAWREMETASTESARPYSGRVVSPFEAAIAAYERAMADAGWRMVRDVGKSGPQPWEPKQEWDDGWNACRDAMLGEDDE